MGNCVGPLGLEGQWDSSPVAHATGRGCVSPPGLNRNSCVGPEGSNRRGCVSPSGLKRNSCASPEGSKHHERYF